MMRLLFVVQRYGREIAGGAELHCRQFATRLAGRGHDVDVLTTCARDYVDWANVYAPGVEELDGVTVHRLPVAAPRDDAAFTDLNRRVVWGDAVVALPLQRHWMEQQGPLVPEIRPWLDERAVGYDVVVFFTYLYYTAWAGLAVAAAHAPTVLHPTAHDEPALWLPLYDTMFRHPAAFAFSTEEEADLVRRRARFRQRSAVIGIGVDLDFGASPGDGAGFRAAHGLSDRPYLLFVGRLEPAKGSEELYDFFVTYKARNPGPLALVLVGELVRPLNPHPDVIVTGFVDNHIRAAAMAGATALVQPSYFESFSMVLAEAWAQGTAAIVQGHCAVLEGQARRSEGGIPYRGFAEFEMAVDWACGHPAETARMGAAGRRYVESNYAWDVVLDRYETLLAATAAHRAPV